MVLILYVHSCSCLHIFNAFHKVKALLLINP
nr:MAG TPA: hypothetical protein [Caudoviricetes sp.]